MSIGKLALIMFGSFVLLAVGLGGCALSAYNGMAVDNEAVDAQWSQVENVYQRRNDLIPNIVATVKGEIGHEHKVFTEVSQAQASVGQVKIDPTNLTPDKLAEWSKAQTGLGGALSKLMMVGYAMPELKSNQAFGDLRATLEGSENRIGQERRNFKLAVEKLNMRLVTASGRFLAGIFGFEKRAYFKADEGAEKAPTVDFASK